MCDCGNPDRPQGLIRLPGKEHHVDRWAPDGVMAAAGCPRDLGNRPHLCLDRRPGDCLDRLRDGRASHRPACLPRRGCLRACAPGVSSESDAMGETVDLYVLLMANAVTISSGQLREGIEAPGSARTLFGRDGLLLQHVEPTAGPQDRRRRPITAVRALRDLRRPCYLELRS